MQKGQPYEALGSYAHKVSKYLYLSVSRGIFASLVILEAVKASYVKYPIT